MPSAGSGAATVRRPTIYLIDQQTLRSLPFHPGFDILWSSRWCFVCQFPLEVDCALRESHRAQIET